MQTSLGQRLKAAREARGLSLADAAHETRVPAARLQHLEEDNYAAFGSMTYARSFLRLYSNYLAVDAGEELEELPSAVFAGPGDYRYLTDSFGPWVMERGKVVVHLADPVVHGLQRIKSPLPAALAVFICVLVATGMFGKYVADAQRTVTQQQPGERIPGATAIPLQTAEESARTVGKQAQVAVPIDPLILVPKQGTHPVPQPGKDL